MQPTMLFGAGAQVYGNLDFAAQALESAEILGADLLAVRDAYLEIRPGLGDNFAKDVGRYVEALSSQNQGQDAMARSNMGGILRELSAKDWQSIIQQIEIRGLAVEDSWISTPRQSSHSLQRFSDNLKERIIRRLIRDVASLPIAEFLDPLIQLFSFLPSEEQRSFADVILFFEQILVKKGPSLNVVSRDMFLDLKFHLQALTLHYGRERFSQFVEGIQGFPFLAGKKLENLRRLTRDPAFKHIREPIHQYPSPANIGLVEREIEKARKENPRLVPALELILTWLREIYCERLDFKAHGDEMGRELAAKLVWPEEPKPVTPVPFWRRLFSRTVSSPVESPQVRHLRNLMNLAISVRECLDNIPNLSEKDYLALAQLALTLQKEAYATCFVDPKETGQSVEALKIAVLITTLYASGYGHKGWLQVARRFEKLSRYKAIRHESIQSEFRRLFVLVAHMVDAVQNSYHDHFDPLVRGYGDRLEMGETEKMNFTANQYRSMAIFQLGRFMEFYNVGAGNRHITMEVLNLFQVPGTEVAYHPYFYGDADFPNDLRIVGGKALGLDAMKKIGLPIPEGFVLPAKMGGDPISETMKEVIKAGLIRLERSTGRSFASGSLKVYVRSGSAISMPGQMLTVGNVDSIEEVLNAICDVYNSWHIEECRNFRNRHGIPAEWGTAVNIVVAVDGTKDDNSGAGVARAGKISFGRKILGFDIVGGKHPGNDLLPKKLEEELKRHLSILGKQYDYPVEVEFAVESGRLWLLQVRRVHFAREEEIEWYAKQVRQGGIDKSDAVRRLGGRSLLEKDKVRPSLKLEGAAMIAKAARGNGFSQSGKIAFSLAQVRAIADRGGRAIFVTDDTHAKENTFAEVEVGAMILKGGNPLSHLEAICRMLGVPLLAGIDMLLDRDAGRVKMGDQLLEEGDAITLDPQTRRIYRGILPIQEGESPVRAEIDFLLEESADTPSP